MLKRWSTVRLTTNPECTSEAGSCSGDGVSVCVAVPKGVSQCPSHIPHDTNWVHRQGGQTPANRLGYGTVLTWTCSWRLNYSVRPQQLAVQTGIALQHLAIRCSSAALNILKAICNTSQVTEPTYGLDSRGKKKIYMWRFPFILQQLKLMISGFSAGDTQNHRNVITWGN
jgi:hypothetical protein